MESLEPQVGQVEEREAAFLRRQEAVEVELKDALDQLQKREAQLAVGHPGEGDQRFRKWDDYDKLASGEAKLASTELTATSVHGGLAAKDVAEFATGRGPADPSGTLEHIRELRDHFKEHWHHRSEMMRFREEANGVKGEWQDGLRKEIDELKGKIDGLDMRQDLSALERSGIRHDAEGVKYQIEAAAEATEQQEESDGQQHLREYAERLDAVIRRLQH